MSILSLILARSSFLIVEFGNNVQSKLFIKQWPHYLTLEEALNLYPCLCLTFVMKVDLNDFKLTLELTVSHFLHLIFLKAPSLNRNIYPCKESLKIWVYILLPKRGTCSLYYRKIWLRTDRLARLHNAQLYREETKRRTFEL